MSEHAEQTLIASCFSHPAKTDAQEYLLELTPDCFEGVAESALWGAMRDLVMNGLPINETNIRQQLASQSLLGVDGQYWPTYRSLLIRCDEPIEKLAQEVKDGFTRRSLEAIFRDHQAKLMDLSQGADSVAQQTQDALAALAAGGLKEIDPWSDIATKIERGESLEQMVKQGGWLFPEFDEAYPIPTSAVTFVVARLNTGKCYGKGTRVVMADGSMKAVEDVQVGDQLLGPDSTVRNVLGTTAGHAPLYRVRLRSGESFVCNGDHILPVVMSGTVRIGYEAGKIINLTVKQYLRENAKFKASAKMMKANGNRFVGKPADLPIPPYILGIWLGDGTTIGTSISSVDGEVVGAWRDYAASIGLDIRVSDSERSCPTYHATTHCIGGGPNALRDKLRSIGVWGNKHIPEIYLTASYEQRMELLAGILDTDGYLANAGKGYDWICKQEAFAKDFERLCSSLGFTASSKPCQKTCTNNGVTGTYHRMFVAGDIWKIPCRVERRKAKPYCRVKDHTRYSFTIEPIGNGDFYGFELDGDHLHLVENFIISHNSMMGFTIARATVRNNNKVLVCNQDMPPDIVKMKLISCFSGVPQWKIQKQAMSMDEGGKVKRAIEELREMVSFQHYPGMTPLDKIKPKVIQAIRRHKPTLVVWDQFSQIGKDKSTGKRDDVQAAYISRSIKNLAASTDTAVLMLAQANRGANNSEPSMADIAETDAIGQDACGVITLWNNEDRAKKAEMAGDDDLFGSNVKTSEKFKNVPYVDMRLSKSQVSEAGRVWHLYRDGERNQFIIHSLET